MNIKEHTTPDNLLRYSFMWSEARLVIAALALLLGGNPPVLYLTFLGGVIPNLLTFSWVISGLSAGYLLYRWNDGKRVLFGGHKEQDTAAFLVMVISGLNLGIVGVFGKNIGMSLLSGQLVFMLTAVIYAATAAYLWKRFKEHGEQLF